MGLRRNLRCELHFRRGDLEGSAVRQRLVLRALPRGNFVHWSLRQPADGVLQPLPFLQGQDGEDAELRRVHAAAGAAYPVPGRFHPVGPQIAQPHRRDRPASGFLTDRHRVLQHQLPIDRRANEQHDKRNIPLDDAAVGDLLRRQLSDAKTGAVPAVRVLNIFIAGALALRSGGCAADVRPLQPDMLRRRQTD